MSGAPKLYECVTCGQELNLLEGLNCQRCASRAHSETQAAPASAPQTSSPQPPYSLPHPHGVMSLSRKQMQENARALADMLNWGLLWGTTKVAPILNDAYLALVKLGAGEGWIDS